MIDEISSSIIESGTGIGHTLTGRSLDTGKERTENKDFRIIKKLEDERKKVQPVYNAKGEIIEYDNYGRHLNIKG